MNWKEIIFKPKWEHKNASIRARAVATGTDPRLIEKLTDIARHDLDAGVRKQAMRRLNDLYPLLRIADADPDPLVRREAEQSVREHLAGVKRAVQDIEERCKIVARLEDQNILEYIAERGDEPVLRKTALRRVSRQGFLGDRALQDTDSELRLWLIDKIGQISTLERIASRSRTTDKQLHRKAGERILNLQIESGDQEALNKHALELCEAVDHLTRKSSAAARRQNRLKQVIEDWRRIENGVNEDLRQRFNNSVSMVESVIRGQNLGTDPTAQAPESGFLSLIAEANTLKGSNDANSISPALKKLASTWNDLSTRGTVTDELQEQWQQVTNDIRQKLQALLSALPVSEHLQSLWQRIQRYSEKAGNNPYQRRVNQLTEAWQQAWSRINEPNRNEQTLNQQVSAVLADLLQRIEKQLSTRDEWYNELLQSLDKLEAALENGDQNQALKLDTHIHQLTENLGKDKRLQGVELRGRLHSSHGRLLELRNWQHWSNDKVRNRLIEEIEQLTEQGLHPDALASRIREAQTEWRQLDASERRPGDKSSHAAAPWMWRKFNTACHNAFKAAKPYFDKRSEIQQTKLEQMRRLAERLHTLPEDENSTLKDLEDLLRNARKSIRRVDEVAPTNRQEIAKQLRAGMDSVSRRLNDCYKEVEKQKQRLIREAGQLSQIADTHEAIAQAKLLQREWQNAGHTRRRKEQTLWKAFREPIDPLFEKLKEHQQAKDDAYQDKISLLKTLCEQAEALAAETPETLDSQSGKLMGLQSQWQEVSINHSRLHKRFDNAIDKFQKRLEEYQLQNAQQQRDNWQRAHSQCQQLEVALANNSNTAETLQSVNRKWPLRASEDPIDRLLQQRLKALTQLIESETEDGYFSATDTNTDSARQLCIEMEFLAGLSSPEEDKQERMNYQVNRLSFTLGNTSERIPIGEEVQNLTLRWYELGPLNSDKYTALSNRFNRALSQYYSEQR